MTATVRLVTVAEIAALYGLRTNYVYRLAHLHQWRRIKLGKVVYYDTDQVDATLGRD